MACERGGRSIERGTVGVQQEWWSTENQNVLCLECALHFKGSALKIEAVNTLRHTSRARNLTTWRNKTWDRKITLRCHLNITKRWGNTCAHSHLYLCLLLFMWDEVSKKKKKKQTKTSLQLSPLAHSSDGGLFKNARVLWGCWIIHLRSVTQPTALFHITYCMLNSLGWEQPLSGSVTLVSGTEVNRFHFLFHSGLVSVIPLLFHHPTTPTLHFFHLLILTRSVLTFYPSLHEILIKSCLPIC